MDERLFLSLFDNLIENGGNIENVINNIIDQIKEYDKISENVSSKSLEGCTDGVDEAVTDCSNNNYENNVSNNKLNNKIIENKKYLYKLINNNNKYLQYALNRLTVGISTNNNNSRANFSHCFHIILKTFKNYVNFNNLVELFLNVYNVNNNTLSSQIKYIFLGRLEVLIQLYKVNFFKNLKDDGIIVRIVESIFEVYEYKTYFQDSVVCLLMLIIEEIEVKEEVYGAIFDKIEKGINENNLLVLLGLCLNKRVTENKFKRVLKWRDLKLDENNLDDDVVLNLFNNLSNNYPIINFYTYFLTSIITTPSYCINAINSCDSNGTRMINDNNLNNYKDKEELLKRLINIINYNLEEKNNINNVKFNLSLVLILIRNLNSYTLLELLFENLKTYFRIVRKYYRHSNESNLKQFVNSYIDELCYTVKWGTILNSNCKDGEKEKIVDVIKLDRNLDKNVEVYVTVYNSLLRLFVDSQVKNREEVREEGIDEYRVRFKLLMALGEEFGNVNVFGKLIKCLVVSLGSESEKLLNNLMDSESETNRNYVLYVSRLIVGNNHNLLVSYLKKIFTKKLKDGSENTKQQVIKEELETYILMLTRYLGGLVNKVSKVNDSHYKLMSEQFEIIDVNLKGVNVDELESLKNKLVKLIEKKESNFKLVILLITTFIGLVNSSDLTDISQLMISYFNCVYKYLNKPKNKSQKELLRMLMYNMFTQDFGSSMSRLLNLMNKLIWKLLLRDEEFVNSAWNYVSKSIKDFESEFESCKEEELEIVYTINQKDNDVDSLDDNDNLEEEEDEVMLSNYNDIYKHLINDDNQHMNMNNDIVSKRRLDVDNELNRNTLTYELLLDLLNSNKLKSVPSLSLEEVFGMLKDYVASYKNNNNDKMKRFIVKLSEVYSKSKDEGNKIEDGKEYLVGDFEKNDIILKMINILLFNKSVKDVIVQFINILVSNNRINRQVFVNYFVFLALTKKTNVNLNVLKELYSNCQCQLNLFKLINVENNKILNKSITKSQILLLITNLINNNNYYFDNNMCKGNDMDYNMDCSMDSSMDSVKDNSNKDSNIDNYINNNYNYINNNNNNNNNNKKDKDDVNYEDVYNGTWRCNVESEDLKVILNLIIKMDKNEGNKQYVKSLTNCVNSLYNYLKKQKIKSEELERTLLEISSNVKLKEHHRIKKYLNNITFL